MKFRDYIVEKTTDKDKEFLSIWNILNKDCKPFIKELKSTNTYSLFYRGLNKDVGDFKKIVPRKNRKPVDTPKHLHKILDAVFYKKFGWPARSEGVFTTADYMDAIGYGMGYIFFPIGKYKYLWSPTILDLYTKIRDEVGFYDKSDFSEDEWFEATGPDPNNDNGTWVYNGKKLNISGWFVDAEKYVVKSILKSEKDEFDPDLMEWAPHESYRKWVKIERQRNKVEDIDKISDLVDTYITTNMKEALRTDNEVMFSCKSYYAIDIKYKDLLTNAIYKFKVVRKK